jgi:hypothetical protein
MLLGTVLRRSVYAKEVTRQPVSQREREGERDGERETGREGGKGVGREGERTRLVRWKVVRA